MPSPIHRHIRESLESRHIADVSREKEANFHFTLATLSQSNSALGPPYDELTH
eukprot:CAMPEP_0197864266 /NCGR_PEP_ID=MMETSP1438-20131217/42376_1 /TAXON_ID=1461541 /ORGANISM="Pterosperma sp., Strain CCMP1384" /LENGTH=52 /DNA_ID=CAMNT_0043482447 /DNA_START=94 /DNA_END=249 /DNA_ORIENTATION=-